VSDAVTEPHVAELRLASASAADYCRSILAARSETFWFLTGVAPYRGFSRPFADRDGRWWWRPKPQFAWALDYFTPLERPPRMPTGRCAFGYQYPVREEQADSRVHFNVIRDLSGYDITRLASQKRRAVRKGLKELDIGRLDPGDAVVAAEACEVWHSHVQRTGWNKPFDLPVFSGHWRPLADHAGTNVLGARDRETGRLCAWLIGRITAGTAWVDTIASHSDRVAKRPNDGLIFAFLYHAARLPGVRHANYFLRSSLETLEAFKQSLGFDSSGLPSRLHVNPLVAAGLRLLKPAAWKRLRGDWPPPRLTGDK